MDANKVQRDIAELENLQKQAHWWRVGATLLTAGVVALCLVSLKDAVDGLTKPGERQQQFVSELSSGIQKDVVPEVQTMANQAIAEVRPQVEAEFVKMQDRVPELAEASYQQINLLQENLPKRGEKVLGDTFGQMLTERETKIREMFPDVTEDKVKNLTKNLSDIAQERAVAVNDKMFSRHMSAMQGIVTNMEKIRLAEAAKPSGGQEQPNWEMALAMLDVARADIDPKSGKASSAALPGPTTTKEATR